MDKKIELLIRSIDLGIFEGSEPSEDSHVYVEIDEADLSFNNRNQWKEGDKGCIIVTPKEWHFETYPVNYCVECLKNGLKNRKWYCGSGIGSDTQYWCKDHYAEKMRREQPDLRCPKCGKGYLQFMTGYLMCSHCNHTESHRHTKEEMQDPNFACTCWIGSPDLRGDLFGKV